MSTTASDHLNEPIVTDSYHKPGQKRHPQYICAATLVTADLVAAMLAIASAMLFENTLAGVYEGGHTQPLVAGVQNLIVPFAGFLIYLVMMGRHSDRMAAWSEIQVIVYASIGATCLLSVSGIYLGNLKALRPLIEALLCFPVFAALANHLAKAVLSWAGVWTLPVIVIADGQGATQVEAALNSDPSIGYRVVRRIDPATVIGGTQNTKLRALMDRYGATRLVIVVDASSVLRRQVVDAALRERIPFIMVPQPLWFPSFSCQSDTFFGHDAVFMSFRDGLSHPASRFVKATADVLLAALLIVVTAPVMLLIALLTSLDGGPVFFAQRRVGAGGNTFLCLKFRTMVVNSENILQEILAQDPVRRAEWLATRKLTDDPRVTRVGRFLRKSSLDELPQLINVLRLQMSFVGPRPIVESEISLYGDSIAQYYATRPGLTGLWQVSGRSNTSYERRIELDVWYVNNWTPWRDVVVVLKTLPVVLARTGAR